MAIDRKLGFTLAAALTTGLGVAACGGTSAGGGPSPDAGFAMRMPAAMSAQVMRYDTSVISVDAGMMGTFEMDVQDEGTIDLAFADVADGVQVTATYSSFNGRMTNPMAGDITVDESDIGGQLVFTLDDRARATVHEAFEVQAEVAQMVGSKTLAYDLFPRFPGMPVEVGQSWTDTVMVEEAGEFASETTTILTYTVAGDTVVDGRSLVKLDIDGEIEMSSVGEQQGMSMSQDLSGSTTGWLLWDAAASMPYLSFGQSDMTGIVSVDMPGAPEMSLSVTNRQHTRAAY